MEEILGQVEERSAFCDTIIDDGGKITLTVNLPGDENIGDVFSWENLRRMASLRINLGTEVFPNFLRSEL